MSKLFEIINPSDEATFEAPDERIAVLATVLLGEGRYGVRGADGDVVMPPILFGWPDGAKFGGVGLGDVNDAVDSNLIAIAEALESIALVSLRDRRALLASGADLSRWNEEKRTSLNDFAKYARNLASRLREKEASA
jgi:hypothetical protein